MRTVNRIASVVLGIVLLAAGLLVIVETLTAAAGRPWPIPADWRDRLATTPLSDDRVLVTSIVVGIIGLLILLAQLIPRRQQRLPAEVDGNIWWVSRRSVERRSAQAAAVPGGAHNPKVHIRGNPRQWRVRLTGDAAPHHYPTVERSVRDELSSVGAPADIDMNLSLRQRGRVA